MWARAGFAFYALLTIFLGIVYSWKWAAAFVVMGLIPAMLIWLVAPHVGNADDYYDWSSDRKRRK